MTLRTRAGIVTAALLLVAAVVTVWAIGRSSAAESEARTLAAMRDSVAFRAVQGYRAHRDSTAVLLAAYQTAERKRLTFRTFADAALFAQSQTVDSLRGVLGGGDGVGASGPLREDSVMSGPASDVARQAIAAYDSLAVAFRAYLRVSDEAASAAASTIAAQSVALATADTALAAVTAARDQWRRAATCRVFGVRCPTRSQAFVAGALVALTVVVVR